MKRWLCVGLISLLMMGSLSAGEVPFDEEHWENVDAIAGDFLGRSAISGAVRLKDVAMRNGTIEVDLAVTGMRGFPGIRFRMVDDGDFESVYVRPHKNNLPDAVQYAPSNKGMVEWQLYSGPGYTGRAHLPPLKWMRLKLDIHGDWAELTIDGQKIMKMPLKHEGDGGGILLNAAPKGHAWYTNFKYTPREAAGGEPAETVAIAEGTVRQWQLSPVLKTEDLDTEVYPGKVAGDKWQTVSVDGPGWANISKVHAKERGWATVLARAEVNADQAKRVRLKIGYSDRVDLFVNGEKVFRGIGEFRSHDQTYLGIVGLNDVVYVDLKKGKNEIMAMVHERFGGWAVWAQIEDLNRENVH